jgi:hypothetical protein
MNVYNEEEIISLYNEGMTAKDIGLSMGTYNTTIRRILLRNCVALRNNYDVNRRRLNVFECMSEEAQYWIGFIAADGSVSTKGYKVAIGLQRRDRTHLETYGRFVDAPVKDMIHKATQSKLSRCSYSDKTIAQYLTGIGVTPCKSKTLHMLIPLTSHMVRGIIDGDGYVRKDKKNAEIATASKLFAHQLSQFFTSNGIHSTISFRSDSIYIVGVYTHSSFDKLYTLLYKDATVWLDRKRQRFTALIDGNV